MKVDLRPWEVLRIADILENTMLLDSTPREDKPWMREVCQNIRNQVRKYKERRDERYPRSV